MSAEQAFDAYWASGPDDDPADYAAQTPIAEDAFYGGWVAATANAEAELDVVRAERDRMAGYWQQQALEEKRRADMWMDRADAAQEEAAKLRAQIPFLLSVIACGESLSADEIEHLRALAAGQPPRA